MFWFTVAAVILSALYMFAKSTFNCPSLRTMKYFNKLPGPKDLPIYIGLLAKVMKMELFDVIPLFKKITEDNNGISAYYVMGVPTVLLTNADYVETIMKSSVNVNKGPEYGFLTAWLGEGILISTGEKWRRRRKLVAPSFHTKIVEDHSECMNRNWKIIAKQMLEANGTPIEVQRYTGRGTLSILFEIAMGINLDDDFEGDSYIKASGRIAMHLIRRGLTIFMWNDTIFKMSPTGKATMADIKVTKNITDKVIQKRQMIRDEKRRAKINEYSEPNIKTHRVFIDALLESMEEKLITAQEIREEVDGFMFGGSESTASSLLFTIFHLARHPEIQEKAYQEQFEIYGYSDRDVTKEDLTKMNYLELVIKESLRLNPPIPQFSRTLVEDVELCDGTFIPAKCKVLINLFLLHRDPKYFPEPDKFDPDRFLPEASKNRHPYSYIPFSSGPRNCIGQKLGLMEMKVAMSIFLRSCKFKAVTKYEDVRYELAMILRTSIPIMVEVTPRH